MHHEGSVSSVVRAKHLHAAVSWDSPAAAGALQAAVDLSSGSDVAAAESHSLLALHRANQAVTLAGMPVPLILNTWAMRMLVQQYDLHVIPLNEHMGRGITSL